VVVSYNSAAELPDCLGAIEKQEGVDVDIYVVDNTSQDNSAEVIRSRFPRVHLIANRQNVGFGRANNQVLEEIPADYYALVNPDAVLSPDAIHACIEVMEKEPDIGVAASRLIYPDGTLHPSCHAFLGLRNLVGETFLLDRALPGWDAVSSLNMPGFQHDRRLDVDWIQGAWLVVRGEVCRRIGGFDPDFFVNGEEMEWCYRIRQAGWRVTFLPGPPVIHVGGASTSPVAGVMFVEVLKGRLRFLEKHRGPLVVLGARAVIASSVLLRATARELMNLWRRLRRQPIPEALRLRVIMFRTATQWVFKGMPVTPFRLAEDEE
jgi:N-acetylglucosaminyl-diphospho-decaprenol L-rhamnosyltransferase